MLSQGIPDDPLLPKGRTDEAIRLGQLATSKPSKMAQVLAGSPFDMKFALQDLLRLYDK